MDDFRKQSIIGHVGYVLSTGAIHGKLIEVKTLQEGFNELHLKDTIECKCFYEALMKEIANRNLIIVR